MAVKITPGLLLSHCEPQTIRVSNRNNNKKKNIFKAPI